MLDLVVLDRVVKLPLAVVLIGCLLFGVLDQDQALGNSVELVFQHYHAFKVDLKEEDWGLRPADLRAIASRIIHVSCMCARTKGLSEIEERS